MSPALCKATPHLQLRIYELQHMSCELSWESCELQMRWENLTYMSNFSRQLETRCKNLYKMTKRKLLTKFKFYGIIYL